MHKLADVAILWHFRQVEEYSKKVSTFFVEVISFVTH